MKTLSGQTLKQMLISASNNLYNHYPEVDALNVFPVPDGDTGMNMNLTLASGAKEIQNRNDDDAYTIALTFSKGLLMGARGNSGVITSQIFRGFASALTGRKTISVDDLKEAFANGSEVAYKAVMRPVEGTILTVIRESSEALKANQKIETIEEAMKFLLKEANASLKRTPDLLPVLKEVGVVDSGGAGLVKIIEGMEKALLGKFVERKEISDVNNDNKVVSLDNGEDEEFGYCTEFILRLGENDNKRLFVENKFKNFLITHGKSVVVVRDNNIVKVHVHTLNPGHVLSYAQNFGEFVTVKVENMTEQHNHLISQNIAEISIEKEQDNNPEKEFAMVAISSGKGIDQMFKDIGVDEIVGGGQTMNPSIEDIISAIKKCNAKNVFVFPNNSNIIMAALQAADVLTDTINVLVIQTKTILQGIASSSCFSPDVSVEENFSCMKDAIKNIKSGSVTYAVKDTKIDGISIKKDYFMALNGKKIISCNKYSYSSLFDLIESMVDDESFLLTVFIGNDVTEKEEKMIIEKLHKKYTNIEIDIRRGDQPVYSYLVGVE